MWKSGTIKLTAWVVKSHLTIVEVIKTEQVVTEVPFIQPEVVAPTK